MPPPRWKLREAEEEACNPPVSLAPMQQIARIIKAEGNNLYSLQDSSSTLLLAELPARFRSRIWLKRGGYVVVDLDRSAFGERHNKLNGMVVHVVRDEKKWRSMSYWPLEFSKTQSVGTEICQAEAATGQLSSSDQTNAEHTVIDASVDTSPTSSV